MKPNHKVIYLVPDDVYSWLWCDDPAPAPSMVEDEAIKYIRADQVDKEIEQLKKDKAELVKTLLEAANRFQGAIGYRRFTDKFRAIANKHANED